LREIGKNRQTVGKSRPVERGARNRCPDKKGLSEVHKNRGVLNCKPKYWHPNLITFQGDETGTGKVPDPFPA